MPAAASITCSQLSTISRPSVSRNWAVTLPSKVWPGSSRADRVSATVGITRSGRLTGASSTSHTPFG